MKHKTLLTLCAITALGATTALGIVKATPASAADDTYTWVGGAGSGSQQTQWDYYDGSKYANWSWNKPGDVTELPNSGDTVVIEDVTYQPILGVDATVSDLTIDSDADMSVSSATLTLDGTGTAPYDNLNGDLILSDSGAVVLFNNSATVGGTGAIIGQDDAAQILIKGITLTNKMVISGQMTIDDTFSTGGTPTFVNGATGVVRADADGTAKDKAILRFAAGLTLSDESGASWEATTDPDAVLQFDVGASCLKGGFLIDGCATLKLNGVTIKTEGSVTQTAGRIVLDNGATLEHNCNSGCSACTPVNAGCTGDCGCP